MRKRLVVAALALAAGAAAAAEVSHWNTVDVTTAPAALSAREERASQGGALHYAGGIYLTAKDTEQFGGVSGLEAAPLPDGGVQFYAITDSGGFLDFTGRFDAAGRLDGVGDMTLVGLTGPDGRPLQGKGESDAEDLSLLPGQPGFLVSFERDHRIVAYEDPRQAGAAQIRVDIPPQARLAPTNRGIEGVAALPGDRIAVGLEDGRIWICPKTPAACQALKIDAGPGLFFTLSGLEALGDTGELLALYRRPNPLGAFDVRIVRLTLTGAGAHAETLAAFPHDMPNMEGIAALPRPGGGWRIFLVSDNDFNPRKATVLAAFDWMP